MDEVLVIVPARMGSERLPGKTLIPVGGRPLLQQVIDAITQVPGISLVIATSNDARDDAIEAFCARAGVSVYRGDPTNVAARFFDLAARATVEHIARISGDSPLFDPAILQSAIARQRSAGADLVTTVSARAYPSGMNVELIKREVFLSAYKKFHQPDHFEHVTPYLYDSAAGLKISGLDCPIENARSYRFVVDTEEDLRRVESIFAAIDRPHYAYSLEEKCAIYDRVCKSISS